MATLRVVRGSPTAEEVAALTALVAAAAAGDEAAAPAATRRGNWNDPGRQHRTALLPGPNAWRAAAR